jgi:DNA-binding CsgD family transcriptional regulator
MSRPIILIDTSGRISYRNRSAGEVLERGDPVYEHEGALACHDAEGSRVLAQALSELAASSASASSASSASNGGHATPANGYIGNGRPRPPVPGLMELGERRSFRLTRRDGRSVAATVIALRPQVTRVNNRRSPQAIFTIFEPGASASVDPLMLTTAFGLTPAETRLVQTLLAGQSPEECAAMLKVKISTVRTHLLSIYTKTGATGHADLLRIVLSAAAI